jgi:hypothetical protein
VILSGSPGGPRRSARGFERKSITRIESETECMKNSLHPDISVLKMSLLVDLQQKVGELVPYHNILSFNHCFSNNCTSDKPQWLR